MSKERLGFDVEREMKHLKKIVDKDDSITISSRFVKYFIEQAERAQKLEDILDQDARQAVLEDLYVENKHYHKTVEQIRSYMETDAEIMMTDKDRFKGIHQALFEHYKALEGEE